MAEMVELVLRGVAIGVGATLLMDGWGWLARRFGVTSLDFGLLGRWIGHLPEGVWLHASIGAAAPIRGERIIGWCAHYAIGMTFSALLLAMVGLRWARSPSLMPALLVGAVTVVAPWFILQPALGAGVASSKTARPVFNASKSLVTHLVYGLGLYLAARVTAALFVVVP